MRARSALVSLIIAIGGLVFIEWPASATAADITGTWEITIHSPTGDDRATYVLKQDREKVTGTYHGTFGPADVTGTVKSDDVVLSVTVTNGIGSFTAR